MKKLGHSVIFKTFVFLFSIVLAAAILFSSSVLFNINREEWVPSTSFESSTRFGNYLNGMSWTLNNLESQLAGLEIADSYLELKQIATIAPAIDPQSYQYLIEGNVAFLYYNETTGVTLTNLEQPATGQSSPDEWAQDLLSEGFTYQQDFKRKVIKAGQAINQDALPPNLYQLLNNQEFPDDIRLTVKLDTHYAKADSLRGLSIQYQKEQVWTKIALIGLGIALLLFVLSWIFLLSFAGRVKGHPTDKLSIIDRIYGEIFLAGLMVMAFWVLSTAWDFSYDPLRLAALAALVAYPVAGVSLLSLIRRYRGGILWKQTLLYQIGWTLKRFYQNRTLFWKTLVAFAAFVLLILFSALLAAQGSPFFILLTLAALALMSVVLLLPAMKWSIQFQKVSQAAQTMGLDAFQTDLQTEPMHADLKKLADALSSTHERIRDAVAEQMKSERLKTDLISNVSHDLRTPLTSIISYLDLMKQSPDDAEKRTEYLGILEQKAQRLKTLTDNLFEAAKASSGSLPVQRSRINLNELVHQVAGEYADRLEEQSLNLLLTEPRDENDQPVGIDLIADGNHLERVLDNLMANVMNHAMKGTRVYLDIKREGDRAVVTLKNISREPLNCSPEELQQRFVRGDQSRQTEGSGLGLAIATSLTELVGGKLTIALDGDLFKAKLEMPLGQSAGNGEQPAFAL